MKHYLIILLSTFTFFCKTEKAKEHFYYPDNKEVLAVIETVIVDGRLPVSKASLTKDTVFDKNMKLVFIPIRFSLASDLRKIIVCQPDTTAFSPRLPNEIYITTLLRLKKDNRPVFSSSDSTFFLFQNDTVKTIDLSNELSSKYFITSSKKQKTNRNDYYDISIPLFSKDFKNAYVEVNHYCHGLCGEGSYYILEKVNGKWTIVDRQTTWIS